jgi:DNA invertase Pin-like site-specific DNA recombinase
MTVAQPPNSLIRAGCYCRISSDPNDRREGVQRQRDDTTALCEIKDWTPAGFYIDNDRSASNGKGRPEWERLLADIEAGTIDAIAAWDQDRSWRMMHELEELRTFFTQLGRKIPLATTGQGDVDLYSPTGVLTAQIKTAVSEHEIAMMKVRMRRAARQKAENGQPHWQHAFGYMPGPNGPVPDPATALLVKAAYVQILAGGSLKDICGMWNDAAAFTLSGKPWTPSLLSPFLRKPRNCGLRTHNREIIGTGNWPALVDESTWRAAQNVMKAPSRGSGSRKSVRRHLLTGLLVCGRCGDTLGGQWTTAKRINYACTGCHKLSVRAEHIEPLLYQLVSGRLAMADAIDLLKAEIHDSVAAERIRLELETLYGELDSIGTERGEGLLTGKQAKLATDIVAAKITKLERQQQDSERLRVFDGIPLGKAEVADAIHELSPDRFRAVLDVLCTVTIAPVGKVGRVPFNPERVQVKWR